MLCSVMLWEPLWCILVNFGAFWCIPCATAWPLNDFLWLLYPSKCPFMDDISDSGQIWNTLLCHAMDNILVLFGAFWCILVHFGAHHVQPHDPSMTCSDSATFPSLHYSIYSRYGSLKSLRTNSKHLPLSWYSDHFSVFWSILVHFVGNPTTPLHWIFIKSSKTCILHIKSF